MTNNCLVPAYSHAIFASHCNDGTSIILKNWLQKTLYNNIKSNLTHHAVPIPISQYTVYMMLLEFLSKSWMDLFFSARDVSWRVTRPLASFMPWHFRHFTHCWALRDLIIQSCFNEVGNQLYRRCTYLARTSKYFWHVLFSSYLDKKGSIGQDMAGRPLGQKTD